MLNERSRGTLQIDRRTMRMRCTFLLHVTSSITFSFVAMYRCNARVVFGYFRKDITCIRRWCNMNTLCSIHPSSEPRNTQSARTILKFV